MLECMLEKRTSLRDAAPLGSLAGRRTDGWTDGGRDGWTDGQTGVIWSHFGFSTLTQRVGLTGRWGARSFKEDAEEE